MSKENEIKRGPYQKAEVTYREVTEILLEQDPDFPVKTLSGVKQMMQRALERLAYNVVTTMRPEASREEAKQIAFNISKESWFGQLVAEVLWKKDNGLLDDDDC